MPFFRPPPRTSRRHHCILETAVYSSGRSHKKPDPGNKIFGFQQSITRGGFLYGSVCYLRQWHFWVSTKYYPRWFLVWGCVLSKAMSFWGSNKESPAVLSCIGGVLSKAIFVLVLSEAITFLGSNKASPALLFCKGGVSSKAARPLDLRPLLQFGCISSLSYSISTSLKPYHHQQTRQQGCLPSGHDIFWGRCRLQRYHTLYFEVYDKTKHILLKVHPVIGLT